MNPAWIAVGVSVLTGVAAFCLFLWRSGQASGQQKAILESLRELRRTSATSERLGNLESSLRNELTDFRSEIRSRVQALETWSREKPNNK